MAAIGPLADNCFQIRFRIARLDATGCRGHARQNRCDQRCHLRAIRIEPDRIVVTLRPRNQVPYKRGDHRMHGLVPRPRCPLWTLRR